MQRGKKHACILDSAFQEIPLPCYSDGELALLIHTVLNTFLSPRFLRKRLKNKAKEVGFGQQGFQYVFR